MAVSKTPLVKQAILDLLNGRAALDDVQRTWGHPGDNLQQESIWLGEARSASTWAHLGAQRRRENPLTVEIHVVVGATGSSTLQTAEERLWELVGEVETALRSDPSLNGTCDFIADYEISQDNIAGEKAWASVAVLTLNCHTTI